MINKSSRNTRSSHSPPPWGRNQQQTKPTPAACANPSHHDHIDEWICLPGALLWFYFVRREQWSAEEMDLLVDPLGESVCNVFHRLRLLQDNSVATAGNAPPTRVQRFPLRIWLLEWAVPCKEWKKGSWKYAWAQSSKATGWKVWQRREKAWKGLLWKASSCKRPEKKRDMMKETSPKLQKRWTPSLERLQEC